jgi:hypothetical protein
MYFRKEDVVEEELKVDSEKVPEFEEIEKPLIA